jgi:hypothetical protein
MTKCWGWLALSVALLAGWACAPKVTEENTPAVGHPDPELAGTELFVEATSVTGIDFAYRNGEDANPPVHAILEAIGGGVAILDYDGDGLLDIYIPGGGYFAGPESREIRGHAGRLYRNLGNWKFADVTREAGLETLANGRPWFYNHAAAVADYDRDGWPDLLVTGWGRIALFRNVPDGKGGRKFVDVSAESGLDLGITWATSAAWGDLDGDGFPDLYVCQYVDWSFANHPPCSYDGKNPDPCTPKMFRGLPHKLFRNTGNGRFVDVSAEAGLREGGPEASKGLGVIIVDTNGDGKPDIYVANDTTDNFLYLNRSTPGHIRLQEDGLLAGVARDGGGGRNGSMGLDAADLEGTGRPALWVTNYENELHALYRNMSKPGSDLFVYYSAAAGLATLNRSYVGWGTGFADLSLRGFEDVFIVNGHVIRHHPTGAPRAQLPVLLRGSGGKFIDFTRRGGDYFRQAHTARGAALADLDNDGRLDLIISHLNEPVTVLRNMSGLGNHWLGIELVGRDNADVVGTRVVLSAGGKTQTRFAKGGGSYASSPDRRLVFGLGSTARIDQLKVLWPDGSTQEWTELPLDRYHVLVQGEREPRKPHGTK